MTRQKCTPFPKNVMHRWLDALAFLRKEYLNASMNYTCSKGNLLLKVVFKEAKKNLKNRFKHHDAVAEKT